MLNEGAKGYLNQTLQWYWVIIGVLLPHLPLYIAQFQGQHQLKSFGASYIVPWDPTSLLLKPSAVLQTAAVKTGLGEKPIYFLSPLLFLPLSLNTYRTLLIFCHPLPSPRQSSGPSRCHLMNHVWVLHQLLSSPVVCLHHRDWTMLA